MPLTDGRAREGIASASDCFLENTTVDPEWLSPEVYEECSKNKRSYSTVEGPTGCYPLLWLKASYFLQTA